MNYTIQLRPDSHTPKYQQLVDCLTAGIEAGGLQRGERLPSINELSEQQLLSKETVERAYHELHHRGLVVSVARRGYFVSDAKTSRPVKVLLLVGDLTESNRCLYRSLLDAAGRNAKIDVFTYGYRTDTCREILNSFAGHYQHVVLLPHLVQDDECLTRTLQRLTGTNIVVLGQKLTGLPDDLYSSVTTDVRGEFYKLLTDHRAVLRQYSQLNLILPETEYVDSAYLTAFRTFCTDQQLEYRLIDALVGETVQPRHLYITADNADLVEAIRQASEQQLTVGRDVGIISLNDSCLHELLAGGVSALSGQAENMGQLAGELLRQPTGHRRRTHHYQPLHFIRRATF